MEEGKEEVKSFNDLGVCEQLVEACDNLGWKHPSKIQAEAIPHALEGSLSSQYFLYPNQRGLHFQMGGQVVNLCRKPRLVISFH